MEIGVRTQAEYLFTAAFERVTVPAQGLFGGHPGARGRVETVAGRQLHPMAKHWLKADDRILLQTPGGAGIGDPLDRDPEIVAEDVRESRVSLQAARELYGVVLDAHGEVDAADTRLARTQRRRMRSE
jgi:N-methylhydantoinase B